MLARSALLALVVATVASVLTLEHATALSTGADAPRVRGAPCSTTADCSLNGDCISGTCACDAAWSASGDCSVMAFQELPANPTDRPGYYNATFNSWGGYPVKGTDGQYHLFHAAFVNQCPLSSWTANSVVARSVSVSGEVEGPYAYEETVLPHFAHNPTIRRAADGTYVIYYIGGWPTNASNCQHDKPDTAAVAGVPVEGKTTAQLSSTDTCNGRSWPKTCGPNMPGPSKDCCGPSYAAYDGNNGCGISMASSKSLSGPWKVQPLIISNQWDSDEVYCAHTNPSPVFLSNGTVLMAFNAGFCHNNLETIGVARADSWEGPYELLVPNAVLRNSDGSPHHCEDPFLFKNKFGWHLLAHNQQGPQGVIAHGFSEDAMTWTLSPTTPYDCTLNFTDGSSATATGCGNRPQLVYTDVNGNNGESGNPAWITNGATAAKPVGSGSWTLMRHLATDGSP